MTNWQPGAHINVSDLRKIDACADLIHRLARRWPAGAALTLKNLIEAAKLGADISWLAKHILPSRALAAYNAACAPARAACDAACTRAWAAYICDPALAAYIAACDPALAAYIAAWAAYIAACAPARAAYFAACARALWFAIGGAA